MDIGNVETVLDALSESCFYLSINKNRYKFSISPNLIKLLTDRKANINSDGITKKLHDEIKRIFGTRAADGIDIIFFPDQSNQVPDRTAIQLIILAPDSVFHDEKKTVKQIEKINAEYGQTARVYKNSLIWCIAEDKAAMFEESRKVLAWSELDNESDDLRLTEDQKKQIAENLKKAERDLKESVWRAYKVIYYLDKNNTMKKNDLGLIHSSAADTLTKFIINKLRQDGVIEEAISRSYLVRNWPPAIEEWSIRGIKETIFASPLFPKLLVIDSLKNTIVQGVANGDFAYVGKIGDNYEPFKFKCSISTTDVEISNDFYIIKKEKAIKYIEDQGQPKSKETVVQPPSTTTQPKPKPGQVSPPVDDSGDKKLPETIKPKTLKWTGKIPPQKWSNFYMKVLTKYAADKSLNLNISFDVTPESGISDQQLNELKAALRELGIEDSCEIL